MKSLAILGSTGSIGRQALQVARLFPQELRVVGLAAGSNIELLGRQARDFSPRIIASATPSSPDLLPTNCLIGSPEEVATHPEVDLVVVATVGNKGLGTVLAALRSGKSVALANKEVMVMAGDFIMKVAHQNNVDLLPIDSEPSAIWQCMRGEEQRISRLIVTASGGALRQHPLEELGNVSPEQALRHPTWSMGRKITIDSATMVNKAFEVIESHWLFNVPWSRIQVVVHPQSLIHSMVEFADGSVKAQLSPPDMMLPIQYALLYPQRLPNKDLKRFDPVESGLLTFEPLDPARYPAFDLALRAGQSGGTYPAVLSAADEVAVERFLAKQINFLGIQRILEKVLDKHQSTTNPALDDLFEADSWARDLALRVS